MSFYFFNCNSHSWIAKPTSNLFEFNSRSTYKSFVCTIFCQHDNGRYNIQWQLSTILDSNNLKMSVGLLTQISWVLFEKPCQWGWRKLWNSELKHKYEILNVFVVRKCRKLSIILASCNWNLWETFMTYDRVHSRSKIVF